jgi:DNA-binding transcriptional LysR family regulator
MKHDSRLLDLGMNLLLSLNALLSERSVSRAAEQMGMTQSGMSHALRQLRELLGDQLLVRSGNAMLLTPRAAQMAPVLQQVLGQLQRALGNEAQFNPATSMRCFNISMRDAAIIQVAPRLLPVLRREAPGIQLDLFAPEIDQLPAQLESGEVDLHIGPFPPESPGLLTRKLFDEELVCLVHSAHPVVKTGLNLEAYLRLPHALITTSRSGSGIVDMLLAEKGHTRSVVLRINSFLAAPMLMVDTDLVLTLPRYTAALFMAHHSLAMLPPPLELPQGRVSMSWHERFDNEPGGRWLRQLVLRVLQPLG